MSSLFTRLGKKNRWFLIGGGGLVIILIVILVVFLFSSPDQTKPGETTANLEQNATNAMAGYGLMPTVADGSVQKDRIVSRSEFASLVSNVLQIDGNVTNQPSYSDVLPNHPQYSAIERVKYLFGYQKPAEPDGSAGLETTISSADSNQGLPKFNPDEPMKRSEAVAILSDALELGSAANTLADSIKLPADDPIRTAADQNLLAKDASRLFYLLIASRLPTPAPTFAVDGVR
jgi:hypothetical protein